MPEGRTRIVYSLIWSNEDGGTGNDLGSLLSRWGSSTDIEWIVDETLNADGTQQSAVIQGKSHRTRPFAGLYRGAHPILRTATTNNNVSNSGTSPLLLGLALLRAAPQRPASQ